MTRSQWNMACRDEPCSKICSILASEDDIGAEDWAEKCLEGHIAASLPYPEKCQPDPKPYISSISSAP